MSKISQENIQAMRRPILSRLLSCVLMLVVPASLWAADTTAAMLYANGPAWLNGASVPKSSAVFTGDLIQTRTDSVANIKATGSNIMMHRMEEGEYTNEEDLEDARWLRTYVGKTGFVQLGWAYQGCIFLYETGTEWYEHYQRLHEISQDFGGLAIDESDQEDEP